MEKTKLINILKKIGVVTKGTYVLHSGRISDYYVDIKKIYSDPKTLSLVANMLSKKIPKQVTCIAATGHGGIPLASLISVKKNLPLVLIRDTEKDHGLMGTLDGYTPNSEDVVAIVDDVYTTGSSIQEITDVITVYGSKVGGAYIVVWRGKNKPPASLEYILRINDLV